MAEKEFPPMVDRGLENLEYTQEMAVVLSNQLFDNLKDKPISCEDLVKADGRIGREKRIFNLLKKSGYESGEKGVFKGVYVFKRRGVGLEKAGYVGISQNIAFRLMNHLYGTSRHTSTWSYMRSKHKKDQFVKFELHSTDSKRYDYHHVVWQDLINNYDVAIATHPNDYVLYLAEIYFAIQHKTFWNVFNTH